MFFSDSHFDLLHTKTRSKYAFYPFIKALSALLVATIFTVFPAQASQEINWLDDEDARQLDSDKPIFVFGEMTFCSACKKMKKEVFVETDIIKTLNEEFIPVRMSTLGIFPNTLDDLVDDQGEPLKLNGSPGFVVIQNNQYSVFYGFQSADTLRKVFDLVLNSNDA
jgi:hypothetical protein